MLIEVKLSYLTGITKELQQLGQPLLTHTHVHCGLTICFPASRVYLLIFLAGMLFVIFMVEMTKEWLWLWLSESLRAGKFRAQGFEPLSQQI